MQVEEWPEALAANAVAYADVAMANIDREFPSDVWNVMEGPGDFPDRPRQRHPVFFGSFDWHSCVEMYWVLVRLLNRVPEALPVDDIAGFLDERLSGPGLEAEAVFIGGRFSKNRQRPYGWGWALALVDELHGAAHPAVRLLHERAAPLAEAVERNFLEWLPKATYPVRYGIHTNSAFGLSRSLPYARRRAEHGDRRLLDALTGSALRWFADDRNYPAGLEPSGTDFLSPALSEAELMAQLLSAERFVQWLDAFLPQLIDGSPTSLFSPAVVSDSSDGHIAHLHGVNASRAWAWHRIAGALPGSDDRVPVLRKAAARHAAAALPHVIGDDYMVEHWLVAYAVLMMSADMP